MLHNIREARSDLTIAVIAHRGSAVMTAVMTVGHAVVLHEGVVTDAGPPKVLLAKIDGPLRVLRGAVERERAAES